MNHYELSFIISAAVPETEHKAVEEGILADLAKAKVELTKEPYLIGRKKLAYPIKQQKHGFYVFLEFNAEETSGLKEVDVKLRHNNNLLRYLIIKKNPRAKSSPIKKESLGQETSKPKIKKMVVKDVQPIKPNTPNIREGGVKLDNIDQQLDNLLEKDLELD
ncbi:MAG: 30S ribosomal protein S6 [Candidatus Komeilibacteria bacterium CG11_big_fil_rev_8_21_14_0_20_36_20]|uniref:Small ribosomal subunit protein bS6 n=1 Tax=Candidatus Komeilibacteria bacterium CG11_big_fil_rev_8_21_14_0_20_36_20 TaxID=1974477 RepID=A0A2H0NCU0_9BACT|nr:MAG: 30S ribosomal protein S6 [Candidatus Komeilibacteria bacterium CG11_big_fil_rev_8_21_14_0_20_36_20]PIR81506.1 MAG: 30S ribosomal protein S6 [Candidatus Komeilibacteria bacterium CG10_big_fil_rev_8_21_14_0_10_36_65]PJC55718.1 MAG: 30S ribosomal protein S6 [Candidatus Komeilibacteria bacterium CG_4_9_14_0_2_um_filter_36_13]